MMSVTKHNNCHGGCPGTRRNQSYRTAWNLMYRIRTVMASSVAFPLTREVEVDQTYICGHKQGKRCYGACHALP